MSMSTVGVVSPSSAPAAGSITNAMLAGSIAESKLLSSTVTTQTTTYAILTTDSVVLCNASGEFTVTLPTAVGATGKRYIIRKIDATAFLVTIATTSAQTISGDTAWYLKFPGHFIEVVSDGTNWHQVSGQPKDTPYNRMGTYYGGSATNLGVPGEAIFTPDRTRLITSRYYGSNQLYFDVYSGSTLLKLGTIQPAGNSGLIRLACSGNSIAADNTYAYYCYCIDSANPPKIVRCLLSDNYATTSVYTGASNVSTATGLNTPVMCKDPATNYLYYAYPKAGVALSIGKVDGSTMTLTTGETSIVGTGVTSVCGICFQNGSVWVQAIVSGALKIYQINASTLATTNTYTPSGTNVASASVCKLLPLGTAYIVYYSNTSTGSLWVMNTADGTCTQLSDFAANLPGMLMQDPVNVNNILFTATANGLAGIFMMETNGSTTLTRFRQVNAKLAYTGMMMAVTDGYRVFMPNTAITNPSVAGIAQPTGTWEIGY